MNEKNSKLVLLTKEEYELIINYRNQQKIKKLLKIHKNFESYTFEKFSDLHVDDIKILLSIHNKDNCAAVLCGHCNFCESGMYNKLLNKVKS